MSIRTCSRLASTPCLKEFSSKEIDPRLIPLLKDRSKTLKEASDLVETELDFLNSVSYDPSLLLNGGKISTGEARAHLEQIKKLLIGMVKKDSTSEHIKTWIMPYADEKGRSEVLWPLRVALTGKKKSPDPFTVISLLDEQETLSRIEKAIAVL